VLTIVSVVGIPPTLVAGIYGMNFKLMPELAWQWGYPFGLVERRCADCLVQMARMALIDRSVGANHSRC
jgi:hypothetical protein